MSKTTIKPSDLGAALSDQLELYHTDIVERVNDAGEKAIKALVKKTKATAPKRTGAFKKAITYTETRKLGGEKEFVWGVKAPHHRLTHLLVHGHDGPAGRVPGDPFLENALDSVLPEYENDVEEALKK